MPSFHPPRGLRLKFVIGSAAAWLAAATSLPALGQAVYQIDCGAGVGCGGSAVGTWIADNYFNGGSCLATSSAIDMSGVTFMNPAPQQVYQFVRQGGDPGSFSYTFTTLTAGNPYTVRFHLAAIDSLGYGAGDEFFSFSVNNTPVRTNYDVAANAGGPANSNGKVGQNKAVIIAATTTADASGSITVTLGGNTGLAFVNGIEVLMGNQAILNSAPTGLTGTGGDGQAVLTWNAVNDTQGQPATGYNVLKSASSSGPFIRINTNTISGTTYTDTGLTNGLTYYYQVLAVNSQGEGPASGAVSVIPKGSIDFQINCGGSAVSGTSWIADAYFSGSAGNVGVTSNAIDMSGVQNSVVNMNPAPQTVYQTVHTGGNPGSITYTFPTLTSGADYTVRLHFADLIGQPPGGAVFDFSVNGTAVRSNYDVDAAAGPNTSAHPPSPYGYKAVIVAANTKADSTGAITVNFKLDYANNNGYPMCNGIEVLTGQLPVIATAPAWKSLALGASGQTLSWGAVSGAVGYNVLRSTPGSNTFIRINPATITSTSYVDSVPGQWAYELLAVNGSGEGPSGSAAGTVSVSANPSSVTVSHGGSAALTVTLNSVYAGAGTVTVSGAPSGVTAFAYPAAVTVAAPVSQPAVPAPLDQPSANINIFVSSSAAPGNYNLTVTAKIGISSQTIKIPLKIN